MYAIRSYYADLDDLSARILQPLDALVPERRDLGIQAVGAVFLRDANLEAADVAGERLLEVRQLDLGRGAVLRVEAP